MNPRLFWFVKLGRINHRQAATGPSTRSLITTTPDQDELSRATFTIDSKLYTQVNEYLQRGHWPANREP